MDFKLHSKYKPAGDQPEAISALLKGLQGDNPYQTLLGVTGSGKTFTLANVVAEAGCPILVLSHNKTLAAQLYGEFKSFFPDNAVELFISYYDYYLPESYTPQTDTYIAKDASVNENIERLRLAATSALIERRDVIIVASVSCIYGLGSPEDYKDMCIRLEVGEELERKTLLQRLVSIQYERNDVSPEQGQFRVRGDSVDIFPPEQKEFIRVSFWGEEIEELLSCEVVTGDILDRFERTTIFPCRHFVMPEDRIALATERIKRELKEQIRYFEERGLLVEAQRIYQRVKYDIEMMKEIGYCSGIENYSRHLSDREPETRPFCLLDFFPEDFITIIDESHVTLPQVRAMYKADRSRKTTLVEHGFRLPSALDNRPLMFDEFMELTKRMIFVSATPGDFELSLSGAPIIQEIRPTGLLDPLIECRPLKGQVDDVIAEIRECEAKNERVIVTTLTKKSAERLSDYLEELGVKVTYLHSDIDAIERMQVLTGLRRGDFTCLVGINLLREGIDLPEVGLVAILDADKEGFLRSARSLLQVAGRAARNENGRVILYGDRITDSMKHLIDVSEKRRKRQQAHNEKYGITPKTIIREIKDAISDTLQKEYQITVPNAIQNLAAEDSGMYEYEQVDSTEDITQLIELLEGEMKEASEALEFERAAELRDQIKRLEKKI